MNYFRQSLINPLFYSNEDTHPHSPEYLSIDSIINQTLAPHDRKDLNKIYQHTDIFIKKNSILLLNLKKHKHLNNARNLPKSNIIPKNDFHNSISLLGKQGALYQEIYPCDVQKNHDDNIFDYRLHMKLAKGDEVFKVEQVKRKQKKKLLGKQCECCGRQYAKYHKCNHSLCERKCGKANLKKGQSRRDMSSMYSDSKDENWSQQNIIDEEKLPKRGEKKSGRIQQHSSSSNKNSHHVYDMQPSESLLASIDKLITEQVLNNFTYRVLQIKQFQNQQDEQSQLQNNQNNDEQFEMEEELEEERDFIDMEFLNEREYQKDYKGKQQIQLLEAIQQNIDDQLLGERAIMEGQGNNNQNKQQTLKQNKGQGPEEQAEKPDEQNERKLQATIQQNQSGFQPNNPNRKKLFSPGEGSSSSQSEIVDNQIIQNLPDQQEELISPISNDGQKDRIDFMDKDEKQNGQSIQKGQDQSVISEEQNSGKNQQQLFNDKASLPKYKSDSDSLNQEIGSICSQQPSQNPPQNEQSKPTKKENKQMKALSKQKIKQIGKEILQSQNLKEISQIQLYGKQEKQLKKDLNVVTQREDLTQFNIEKEKNVEEKHGKGKGKGMGQGYGIFQEQLDIYNQDKELLEENYNEQISQINQLQPQNQPQQQNQKTQSIKKITESFSKSSQPLTPRRRIPNMQSIIEQIKLQSQKVQQQKGLGRGKLFGNGLGVLQQSQQIQKQLANGDQIVDGVNLTSRKRVKLDEVGRIVENNSPQGKLSDQHKKKSNHPNKDNRNDCDIDQQQRKQQEQIKDKFDELIGDNQQFQNRQGLINEGKVGIQIEGGSDNVNHQVEQYIGEEVRKEQEQQMQYIAYLNKKVTLIHPNRCEVDDPSLQQQSELDQQQEGEEQANVPVQQNNTTNIQNQQNLYNARITITAQRQLQQMIVSPNRKNQNQGYGDLQ